MSIFPTKILLATDGSKEARLALTTAADMAQSTDSELHVAYVFPTAVQRPFPNPITARPREVREHELEEAMQQAQTFLDQQVERVKEEGVSVAEAHLIRGRPDLLVLLLKKRTGLPLGLLEDRVHDFPGVEVMSPELPGRRKHVGDVHLRACFLGELGGGLCGLACLFGAVGGQ